MSPGPNRAGQATKGFPRVSGDEPARQFTLEGVGVFSPRERG